MDMTESIPFMVFQFHANPKASKIYIEVTRLQRDGHLQEAKKALDSILFVKDKYNRSEKVFICNKYKELSTAFENYIIPEFCKSFDDRMYNKYVFPKNKTLLDY